MVRIVLKGQAYDQDPQLAGASQVARYVGAASPPWRPRFLSAFARSALRRDRPRTCYHRPVNRCVPLLLLLAATSVSALQLTLDPVAITAALRIGQSSLDREREAFHAPYRLAVSVPPIDYVDIITPFRRVALASEQRMRLGERSLSQRQAMDLLATTPGLIEVVVQLTFHPMHAMVRVPDYQVRLISPAGTPIEPRSIDLVPRFGPRLDNMPVPLPGVPTEGAGRTAQPMLGGSVIAAFDGSSLDAKAAYQVAVLEQGKELARTRLELTKLR